MPIDGGISSIAYVVFSLAQLILGSISIYSLFNDAIIAGFAFMILLYVFGFIKSRYFGRHKSDSTY
jgi:hypothetical protein